MIPYEFGPNAPSRHLVSRLREDPDVTHDQLARELRERWPESVGGCSSRQIHVRWTLPAKKALAGRRPVPKPLEEEKSCTLCGKLWRRDPVLEVECPTCGAGVGQKCRSVAPSGHAKSAAFQGLPPHGHDARDLKADEEGAYGRCPYGQCRDHPEFSGRDAESDEPEPQDEQMELAV